MKFEKITDAVSWLESQKKFREKTSLDYIEKAYKELDIDLSNIKKVHIAGTNGKGSTAAFLTNILYNNVLNVGTFTSPYLVSFNERIRINNKPISDEDLLYLIDFIFEFNEKIFEIYQYRLSFFELLTLIAIKHFSDNNCDVIIMEAGIGGRLDATNILKYDVSIITSIGFDHMEQLGSTLEDIANEKIAILKPKGFLLSSVSDPIKNQFIKYANKVKAKYKFIKERDFFPFTRNTFYYKSKLYKISLLGDYQRQNAILAIEAAKYLYDFNNEKILPYLERTKWDGRLEEIKQNIYLDGAHNLPAITALMRNITYLFDGKKVILLFSALKDKQIKEMLEVINKYNVKLILTSFPDVRFKSLEEFSTNEVMYLEDGLKTFRELTEKVNDDTVLIATGSLHFIGYLKQNI